MVLQPVPKDIAAALAKEVPKVFSVKRQKGAACHLEVAAIRENEFYEAKVCLFCRLCPLGTPPKRKWLCAWMHRSMWDSLLVRTVNSGPEAFNIVDPAHTVCR